MLFRTHIVFSLVVYFLISYYVEIPFYVLIFVLLATVFVDIDVKSSKFGNRWYFRPLQWVVRHRGIFHSLFFAVLISLIIGGINLWVGFGFFVGYLSHLFLDCFTRSGVRLFWPLRFKIKGFVRSGGIIEEVVFVLFLLGDVFWLGILLVVFG